MKIIIKHKRCKHGIIKPWCSHCNETPRTKTVRKILKPKKVKRMASGKFAPQSVDKALNGLFICVGAFLIAFSGFFYAFPVDDTKPTFISPVGAYTAPEVIPEPTPTMSPVEQEIRKVFGEHADDAVEIAKCESGLRENALNDNTTWGGVGRDHGVFQINDVYHPAHKKFYYDYEINIAMAYKIFKDAGYTWQPWTCKYIFKGGDH